MKRLLLSIALAALTLAGPTGAQAEVTELNTLGESDKDWGAEDDPEIYPIGDALGQELVGAAIGNGTEGVADFIIRLKSLPASGGIPEFSRYVWDMNVNGKFLELDGKFTNYSRGACDPTAGKCGAQVSYTQDPLVVNATVRGPRDPGATPFFIRGDCTQIDNTTICQEKGIVQGVFDPATATITVSVPISQLGVTEGCATIAPDVNIFGGSISASPAAFFSSTAMPMDFMELDPEESVVVVC